MEEVYYLKLLIAAVGFGTALVTSVFNYILYDRKSRDIERALKAVQEELRALKADVKKGYAAMKVDAAGALEKLVDRGAKRLKDSTEKILGGKDTPT